MLLPEHSTTWSEVAHWRLTAIINCIGRTLSMVLMVH